MPTPPSPRTTMRTDMTTASGRRERVRSALVSWGPLGATHWWRGLSCRLACWLGRRSLGGGVQKGRRRRRSRRGRRRWPAGNWEEGKIWLSEFFSSFLPRRRHPHPPKRSKESSSKQQHHPTIRLHSAFTASTQCRSPCSDGPSSRRSRTAAAPSSSPARSSSSSTARRGGPTGA